MNTSALCCQYGDHISSSPVDFRALHTFLCIDYDIHLRTWNVGDQPFTCRFVLFAIDFAYVTVSLRCCETRYLLPPPRFVTFGRFTVAFHMFDVPVPSLPLMRFTTTNVDFTSLITIRCILLISLNSVLYRLRCRFRYLPITFDRAALLICDNHVPLCCSMLPRIVPLPPFLSLLEYLPAPLVIYSVVWWAYTLPIHLPIR